MRRGKLKAGGRNWKCFWKAVKKKPPPQRSMQKGVKAVLNKVFPRRDQRREKLEKAAKDGTWGAPGESSNEEGDGSV